MTDTIAGLPFWQLTFDERGDTDTAASNGVASEIRDGQITDLIVFSHGWNNSQQTARNLYSAWFSRLAPQVASARAGAKVGLVGVFWPSQRWSDEPIPDFDPAAAAGGGGAAALHRSDSPTADVGPEIDAATLEGLHQTFPTGIAHLDRMADLLTGDATDATLAEFMTELTAFATSTAVPGDDGESATGANGPGIPRMLDDEPADLFQRFTAELRDSARPSTGAGGAAALTDTFTSIWKGAKEALRQATYWQMKNRAGAVGQKGLGPFVGHLHDEAPDLRVHLVGHSFGARLVSYALAGLPDSAQPSPIKSVTLLQGAFSHFAFAGSLPFDAARTGALAGKLARIDGPLAVCFSSHDDAVGRFYPLACITSGDDSAAAQDRFYRWGGMGHDGAQAVQAVQAKLDALQPAGPASSYRFEDGKALNIDASEIVSRGGAPSGAHSDIVHPELTWVVLKAGKIVT